MQPDILYASDLASICSYNDRDAIVALESLSVVCSVNKHRQHRYYKQRTSNRVLSEDSGMSKPSLNASSMGEVARSESAMPKRAEAKAIRVY
jgi:hypothetical protein